MATSNAINANTAGLVRYNGTGTFDAVTTTQHDLLVGAASNGITNVAPSATSGVPVISQGAAADPTFGTAVVAGGGTGQTTLTNHGVLVGAATSPITQLAVGADHSLLLGATGADPAFSTTGTPYVTSISFDAGTNALNTYAVNSWTPTLVGESSAGTTTYSFQEGMYIKIGKLVWIYFDVGITAATGTGNVNIANLPFAINTGSPPGSVLISVAAGWPWPASTTQLVLSGRGGTSTIRIQGLGSGIGIASLQMSNNIATFRGVLMYNTAT